MEILFVTPEVAPYSRASEVGDVCAALPKALRGLGHRVTIVSPLYNSVEATAHSLARRLSTVDVEFQGATRQCAIYDGRTTGGVDLVFIGHDELFTEPETRSAEASAVFCRAALIVAENREAAVEVVHVHDAFAAPVLEGARQKLPSARRVLSIYSPSSELRSAIGAADRVVAISQADVTALTDASSSHGLAEALAALDGHLTGIPIGLDASIWNPVTDPCLPARFDPVDLTGKARCKGDLQFSQGLALRPEAPLLAVLGGCGDDDSVQAVAGALGEALRNDVQVFVEGRPEDFAHLTDQYPEQIAVAQAGDDAIHHRAVAAADLVLVPPRPRDGHGLALSAQRYGAIPIVLAGGSCAEGVIDCDAVLQTGSGFVYDDDTPATIGATSQRAVAAFAQRDAFAALRRRAMALDTSWDRGARRYEYLYKD